MTDWAPTRFLDVIIGTHEEMCRGESAVDLDVAAEGTEYVAGPVG